MSASRTSRSSWLAARSWAAWLATLPRLRVSDEDELPRTGERLHDVLPDAHGRRQASDSRCEPAIGPICSIPPSTDQEAPVT